MDALLRKIHRQVERWGAFVIIILYKCCNCLPLFETVGIMNVFLDFNLN